MDCKFKNDFVVERLFELNQVEGINEHTVNQNAVEEITRILKLNYWTDVEQLRNIRNSIVEIYGAFMKTREYLSRMSAITAVIDHKMFEEFGEL